MATPAAKNGFDVSAGNPIRIVIQANVHSSKIMLPFIWGLHTLHQNK